MFKMFERKKGPVIEERIHERLSGGAQKSALEYVAFLRANGFKIKWIQEHNGWSVQKEKASPVYLNVGGVVDGMDAKGNRFGIVFNHGNFQGPADGDLKEFAWAHVLECPKGCGGTEICERAKSALRFSGKNLKPYALPTFPAFKN